MDEGRTVSAANLLGYEGKRALVVGGATGMGAAAAVTLRDLGAQVTVMDVAPVDHPVGRVIAMDLRDAESIDGALAELGGPVDTVFAAAGIADGPDMMRANFIGHRHLVEQLLAGGWLPRGSAVCLISSVAGMGWENDLDRLQEFLATPSYQAADDWVKAHEAAGFIHYGFSKQAINAYVAWQGYHFLKQGVRINAICPGPTDTPLARANADLWLSFGQDYRDELGIPPHSPEQMGNAMVLMNSAAAGGVSGVTLLVDSGHAMASVTNSFPPGKPLMDILTGRVRLT